LTPLKDRSKVVPMTENAITVEGVRKCFGSIVALEGIDLAVPTGTVFGLLGPNGAGKTTAVRILTTILRPDEGRATVLGHDVVREADAVREHIGLAGQYAAVDENLTGRENLRLIGKLTHLATADVRRRADELLDQFGLTDAADRPAKTYSGGMRRRLDVAAALVHKPPVLFLDEPTTGLDPASRNDLWLILEGLVAEGATLLLTTQYLEEADRLADRLAVIDHGRVIAEGTSAELKANLGATVVTVGLPDTQTAVRVAPLLEPFGDPRVEADQIELTVDNGPKALVEILRRLDDIDVEPTTLAVREPSLDDVFLALTGRHATITDDEGGEA
jgi:ABC-2 type transport system ATP-binding protein